MEMQREQEDSAHPRAAVHTQQAAAPGCVAQDQVRHVPVSIPHARTC